MLEYWYYSRFCLTCIRAPLSEPVYNFFMSGNFTPLYLFQAVLYLFDKPFLILKKPFYRLIDNP